MPELSDQQRRKLTALEPWFAQTRLVRALELKWEVHFRCVMCLTAGTWRREAMLGRARPFLSLTMAEIQKRAPCPRCGARRPAMWCAGPLDPGPLAERYRWEVVIALRQAGLDPAAYGYEGWTSLAGPR